MAAMVAVGLGMPLMSHDVAAAEAIVGGDLNGADRRWAVYYGWPSLVNGAGGDVGRAVAAFSPFRVLVLGDGLDRPSHGDHEPTRRIIAGLNARGTTDVYGYVDLGVSTQNLSLAQIRESVDRWAAIGASGIMLDDAGADYGVTPARLNAVLDQIHGRGLKAILNAWNPDDALKPEIRVNPGDGYLAESYQVSGGRYQPIREWASKADKIARYKRSRGIVVYALATGNDLGGDAQFSAKLDYAWWSTLLYGFDYFQYTNPHYSADGPGANKLTAHRLDATPIGARYLGEVEHAPDGRRHVHRTDGGAISVVAEGNRHVASFSAGVAAR
jgi:hypothetical protein